MTVQTIPYMEKIASDYLRSHADVEALDARVLGKPPSDTSTPWVQVTQLAATNAANSRVEHLVEYMLQFDCYATETGGQPEANTLARTVRAALIAMPEETHSAVVTSARIVGHIRLPDTDFEPARDREVLTATIHAHG